MAGVCARARGAWCLGGCGGILVGGLVVASCSSLGARSAVLRALRTGIFVLSKKYAAPPLTLDVVAEVVMDGWRC